MGGQMLDSPLAQVSPLKKYGRNRGYIPKTFDQTDSLGTSIPVDLQKLVHGVLEAYANILRATEVKKSGKGTNSLMSACLKKLPAYIELEEHFAELDQLEEEEEDERDVANEIYEHLETRFEQRPGQGWRFFKNVLRAHGTSLLCSAVTDKVIGMDSLLYFHDHCLMVGAYEEAEELLVAALPSVEPLPIPTNVRSDLFDKRKSPYMSNVKSFVDSTSRHRFLYDLLEHMVAHELLPLEWLATSCMRPFWDRLVRTISEGDQRTLAHCSRFLETCMLAGMGLPDERLLEDEATGSVARRFVPSCREDLRQALNTTFSSLLTVLCSIALVNNGRQEDAGKVIAQRVTWMLDTITIALAARSDIEVEIKLLDAGTNDLQMYAQRASWAIFASLLVHLESGPNDGSMISLSTSTIIQCLNKVTCQYIANGVNASAILATVAALISATARGTGRIWQDDGYDQIQRLVQTMFAMSGHRLPHKLWTLKRIALESATEFANDTDEAQHLQYARELERKLRTSGRLVIMPTPRKTGTPPSANSGGFRWEDGIGEWVACTPFVKQNNSQAAQKPLRALELLPTPAQSEDEHVAEFVEDSERESDDEPILPSSPIKHAPRRSTSSLGKRTRASSPVVLIPAKRTQITPPDTPVAFYPDLPEDKPSDGERRLRRSTTEIKVLRHKLKSQRSRSSLESGLRDVRRVTYEFALDGADDSEDELSFGF
jgi:hypothetical protein